MARDFYEVLGVSKSASDDEIKKAYRKLARAHHPDVAGDDADPERFKEISEAYAVLSDSDKRRLYDKYGDAGVREGFDASAYERARSAGYGFGSGGFRAAGFGSEGFGVDLNDLFGAFGGPGGGSPFGGGFGSRQGRDITLKLKTTFEKAARGFSTRFTYDRPSTCTSCGGTGANGKSRCPACGGRGLVSTSKSLTVNIPAGADDGDRIRLRGKGADGGNGAAAGDLILELQVEPHERFAREGLNLITKTKISPLDSMLGTRVSVEWLDGSYDVRVPRGVASGQRLRIRGKGIERKGARGDILVELVIDASLVQLSEEDMSELEAIRARAQAAEDVFA